MRWFPFAAAFSAALAPGVSAPATWSIVIADEETKEVAVGTVTCLTSFDLLDLVPVVVVGQGAAAVQAAGDFDGIRRPIIFAGLMDGTPPNDILDLLALVSGHESRQYGIVDTNGGTITFSGSQNSQWAGGVTGAQGTMHYAIQGNILAGGCVVPAIEQAILTTPGDVPARLLAGMQAARDSGGDGRCSCSTFDPTGCGCPPAEFDKSGHIGGMIVARIGDVDDSICNAAGCADGDYFMRLNVAFQGGGDPDPVDQLEDQFAAWRADLIGRPDAVATTVSFDPPIIPPNGVNTTTMTITPLDFAGDPAGESVSSIVVEHGDGSAGLSSIGPAADNGDGTFGVELTAGASPGVDRFVVTIDDGVRPVVLMPEPSLQYFVLGDVDGDGAIGTTDLLELLALWGPCPAPCTADLDGDGVVGIGDLLVMLGAWG